MLHLLSHQPLCVCHFQNILGASQVKISKHLAYLREHALVETRKEGAWVVYSMPENPTRELAANLKCLQDCVNEDAVFKADLRRMTRALGECGGPLADCCPTKAKPPARRRRLQSSRS